LHGLHEVKDKKENLHFKSKASRTMSMTLRQSTFDKHGGGASFLDALNSPIETPTGTPNGTPSSSLKGSIGSTGKDLYGGSLSEEKARELDMDHIYIGFSDFLWAHCFIGPMSYFLWKKNVAWLIIRQYLVKIGLMKVKPMDIELVVGKCCLELSQVIHYYGITEDKKIAGFFFADFPYINKDCQYEVADLFAVDIDLTTKKMVKAKLDNKIISPEKALILLWFNGIAAQHVKLHSLANWGVNSDPSTKDKNPFFHRNSVVTTMYNYFGYSCFHNYMEEWERQGLLSAGWDPAAWVDCVNHGIKQNIWQHQNIDDLMPHSEFVNFITKVRSIFMSEFKKYKYMFPGVHGEAMFVGTIMHSLDHCLLDWNLEDPLWLDVNDPEFGKMAEIGRIVKMGFVKDVPGLYFHKRFKGSGHPFYDSVYAKAAKVNKKFADNMDTCIIK